MTKCTPCQIASFVGDLHNLMLADVAEAEPDLELAIAMHDQIMTNLKVQPEQVDQLIAILRQAAENHVPCSVAVEEIAPEPEPAPAPIVLSIKSECYRVFMDAYESKFDTIYPQHIADAVLLATVIGKALGIKREELVEVAGECFDYLNAADKKPGMTYGEENNAT